MMTLLQAMRAAMARRAAYRRTVRELFSLPIDTALDLEIYRGDVRRIARRAVYGA